MGAKKKYKPTQAVVMLSKKHLPKRKLVGLMILTVLVVTIVSLTVLFLINKKDDSNNAAVDNTPKTTADFVKVSDDLKYTNNYDKAASTAAAGYDAATNDTEKYELALQTGAIYETNKDYKDAIVWYLKADELKPGQRGSLVGLARCYEADGQKDKAIEYYKKVLALKDVTGSGVQSEQPYYQWRLDQLTGATQ
jgi:tetratricopeptide (TPR) repeat protein